MNASDNIPLLNDIIQLGDTEMKNHFDGHTFDEEKIQNLKEALKDDVQDKFENEFDAEVDPVPEIKVQHENDAELDDLQLNLLNNDIDDIDIVISNFSENIETIDVDDDIETTAREADATPPETILNQLTQDELTEMISLLVSDAVDSTLPMIETQLKQSITEQILQKLSRKIL